MKLPGLDRFARFYVHSTSDHRQFRLMGNIAQHSRLGIIRGVRISWRYFKTQNQVDLCNFDQEVLLLFRSNPKAWDRFVALNSGKDFDARTKQSNTSEDVIWPNEFVTSNAKLFRFVAFFFFRRHGTENQDIFNGIHLQNTPEFREMAIILSESILAFLFDNLLDEKFL